MRSVGKVAALFRYPVKSLQGERLERVHISRNGFPGDRAWSFYEPSGRVASAKRHPKLMLASARFVEQPLGNAVPDAEISWPDGTVFRTDQPERVPAPFALKAGSGKHFDDLPLHLITTASLSALKRLSPSVDFDTRRFRPNILVEPDHPTEKFPELAWIGKSVRVGTALLKIEKGTKRCVMTTHPQPSLPKDLAVLQTITDEAGAVLGVYATVSGSGLVAVGDALHVR